MNAFFTYGPMVLSGGMMAVMVYTSLRVWRAHVKAVRRLEEYGEALKTQMQVMKENPDRWLEYHRAMDDKRRQN